MLYLADVSQFILPVSYWWIFVCLIVGLAIGAITYYRHKFLSESKLKFFLAGIRILTLTLIAALMLSPFFRSRQSVSIEPNLLILRDNSSSIKYGMTSSELNSFDQSFAEIKNNLAKDFKIKNYIFGSDLSMTDSLDYQAKNTDITSALKHLSAENVNQHVGGIVLISDGIYNTGINPIYSNLKNNVPIYTVAIGDTSENIDLLIQNVRYNKTIYTGDEFELRFEVVASGLKGQTSKVELKDSKSNLLFQNSINIDQSDFIKEYSTFIKAKEAGIQKYSLSLSFIDGELTTRNNQQSFYVQIIDGRQEVIFLYDSPHPDVQAIRRAVEAKENYSFSAVPIDKYQFNINVNSDIYIFHGLEENQGNWKTILAETKKREAPTMFILPPLFSTLLYNNAQDLAIAEVFGKTGHDIFPSFNNDFNYFNLSERFAKNLEIFPPLISPLVNFKYAGDYQVLLNQRIARTTESEGLMWMGLDGKRKIVTIAGEGLWRWRMAEFARFNTAENFDQLFSQTIQYLGVKEDRRKFIVESNKNIYNESDQIILTSILYNENFEMINSSDVFATITNDEGTQLDFVLNKSKNAYDLNIGSLNEGSYTIEAKASLNGKTYNAQHKFTVEPVYLEDMSLQANHRLLYQLSENSGGKMFTPDQLNELEQHIWKGNNMKPIIVSSFSIKPLIEFKWLLVLLLSLLGFEWFLRKYYGSI